MEGRNELNEQIDLSKLVSRGFIFSIVWLGGFGSLIALICGIRALVRIRRSDEVLVGRRMAWWCIVAGGIGLIVGPWAIYSTLAHQHSR